MVFAVVGGDGKPTGYEIDNSLRFNDDDNPNLSRTPSSASNRKTWTWSGWVKRGNISIDIMLLTAGSSGQGVYLTSGNKFNITKDGVGNYGSDALLRDVSAWYHLVVAVDTTQTGMANIAKFYINGTEQSTSGTTLYSTNEDTNINNNVAHYISRWSGSSANNWHDGYLADINFIDGLRLDASYFGETNDNGVWIPKKYDGSYGTNGFFLEFQQTGTSQNSSGMGADTSGNDNHFTPTNLAATDITTDTPTNNFCTLNPLSAGSDIRANGSFKEGNCELVNGGTGGEANGQKCSGTIGFANGKWYWEVKLISNTMTAGIVDSSISTSSDINLGSKNAVTYDSETGIIANINGNVQGETVSSQYDDNDIIGVAVDADNGFVYFAKNNTYQNSGVPTSGSSGTGGASFTLGNQMLPLAADNSSASVGNHQYNFGNAPFSISSGNTDANGYGNFEYAPPSGYYAVCTKNLAEYG
jgi:hypothetical protein